MSPVEPNLSAPPCPRPGSQRPRSPAQAAALLLALVALAALAAPGCSRSKHPPLIVHVLDAVTGKPLEGAAVRWCFMERDPETSDLRRVHEVTGTSDRKGLCVFAEIPPQEQDRQVFTLVEADLNGYCLTSHVDSCVFAQKSGLELELGMLPRGAKGSVEGEVHDARRNAPLAGVKIHLEAELIPGSQASKSPADSPPKAGFDAETDAQGHFRIEVQSFALDRDSYWLTATMTRPGWSYAVLDLGATRTIQGGRIHADYAHLRCAGWLSDEVDTALVRGQLLDGHGQPIKGEELLVSGVHYTNTCPRGCHGGEPHPVFVKTVSTDGEGRFTCNATDPFLYGLPNGLRVSRADDVEYWRTPLGIGQSEGNHRYEFADGSAVEVTVVAAGGARKAS